MAESNPSATPRLYDDLAWLWPHLSPPEHYVTEAARLNELIAKRLGPGPKRILELGAGGGHTLVHLAQQAGGQHDCAAVDLSEPMLDNCRALIPGIEAVAGDMRDVRLGRTFDVVLIHDAIDYLLTPGDVMKTLATVNEHLVAGGLAVIAPTYTHETFVDGEVADDGTTTDSAELTYFTYVHDPDPADDTFEMILLYLIRDQTTRQVETVEDRHAMGLFQHGVWLQMIEDAGLRAEYVEQGEEDAEDEAAWALFVGTKP
ncbi:class I SAM-dependent methyltransferase [Algisphaera agarilytica]|uniref:SAM-dependent methyltransferase n=1 Tax=Algisphaera agarilytica TaxID=1385975 RepID=A0A7X0LK02_9BACT|nr:class I SAM-dependent methyltransferase [Algisphaera agarilytica]MBB6429314.1 SAM-dependent methyltransferase [Algisphaera agarilytica]